VPRRSLRRRWWRDTLSSEAAWNAAGHCVVSWPASSAGCSCGRTPSSAKSAISRRWFCSPVSPRIRKIYENSNSDELT
jgi:hypothetical protein